MKAVILILGLVWGVSAFAQGLDIDLKYWDGTFAYNTITVKNAVPTGEIEIVVSGADMNIGKNMEPTQISWAYQDRVTIKLDYSDCDLERLRLAEISCDKEHETAVIEWQISSVITKRYVAAVRNVQLRASNEKATLSFAIPQRDDFTPVVQEQVYEVIPLRQ